MNYNDNPLLIDVNSKIIYNYKILITSYKPHI